MKIFEINGVPYGSTGRIMLEIKKAAEQKGYEVEGFTGYSYHPLKEFLESNIVIGGKFSKIVHMALAALTGLNGFFSVFPTLKVLNKLNEFKPDIIHLHNIHGHYINLPMLFSYIKKNNIKVIWTLHDCWAFTGHCAHFDMIGCDKWKTACFKCPQYRSYPKSYIDNSRFMYSFKKKWFTGVKDLTIVTPSNWLGDLVKQSFLKEYPVKVINNGIDLSVFRPTNSNFRKKYGLENKFVLLGVSFGWSIKKGLDVFIELSKRLEDKFKIVLVGTNDDIDKQLPQNIISIHRTQNSGELVEIYSAADIFINPTREENFPTVNMEAIACGTPVLTFDTGGSPEIPDETCGAVVEKNDIDALYSEIIRVCEEKPYSEEACIKRAKSFDAKDKFNKYIKFYSLDDRCE